MNEKQLQDFRLMRNNLRQIKRQINTLQSVDLNLGESLGILDQGMEEINDRLGELEKDADPSSGIPLQMRCKADLMQFVNAKFYYSARINHSDGEIFKNEVCKVVRNALIDTYSNIQLDEQWLLDGDYDRRHLDAFFETNSDSIIDFVVASSDGGRLIDKLSWTEVI